MKNNMKLCWDDLKYFLTVYEQGSFSAAARALKLGQPTLSRRIAELEADIGEALFERNSQGTTLTSTGCKLLPAAKQMADWAQEAELQVKKQTYSIQGNVRIAAPAGIAREILIPIAAQIRNKHPQLHLTLLSGVEILNLGRGEADLSLRTIKPQDSDLVSIKEIITPLRVYASEAYAQTLPSLIQLADIDWIGWATPYQELPINQEMYARIPKFTPVLSSDDFLVQLAACEAGIGAMLLPEALYNYACQYRTVPLKMIEIDLGKEMISNLYLVCHKRHRNLPKVELVVDHLIKVFDHLC